VFHSNDIYLPLGRHQLRGTKSQGELSAPAENGGNKIFWIKKEEASSR